MVTNPTIHFVAPAFIEHPSTSLRMRSAAREARKSDLSPRSAKKWLATKTNPFAHSVRGVRPRAPRCQGADEDGHKWLPLAAHKRCSG